MMQRIEDWLRERRIAKLRGLLVAANDAGRKDEVRRLYGLFAQELKNRSPQQRARMECRKVRRMIFEEFGGGR